MGGAMEEAEEAQFDAEEAAQLAQESLDMAHDAEGKAEEAVDEFVEAVDEQPVADEAEAVGDPHMTLTTGEKRDLCCDGSVCKACPYPALPQHDEDVEAGKRPRMGMGSEGEEAFEVAFEAQGGAADAVDLAKEALNE